MPTYEYRCEECQHQFEVFARMSDPPPAECASCGSSQLTKVLFPVAIQYKGSGFYATDYAGKGAKAESGGGSSDAGGGGSSEASSGGSSEAGSTSGSGASGGSAAGPGSSSSAD